jgi:hypothetical protein
MKTNRSQSNLNSKAQNKAKIGGKSGKARETNVSKATSNGENKKKEKMGKENREK